MWADERSLFLDQYGFCDFISVCKYQFSWFKFQCFYNCEVLISICGITFDSNAFIFLYKYAIFLSVPEQDDKGADPKMGTINVFYIYNK